MVVFDPNVLFLNSQTCSLPSNGNDSKISNYFPVSPTSKDTNSSSESPSNTSLPTRTMKDSTLNTDKEEERGKPSEHDEQKSVNPNTTSSSSKDDRQVEGHGDGSSRTLKQSLLSPKSDSGSVPAKPKRKTKTNSSKG